jgi:hypothetical protein
MVFGSRGLTPFLSALPPRPTYRKEGGVNKEEKLTRRLEWLIIAAFVIGFTVMLIAGVLLGRCHG